MGLDIGIYRKWKVSDNFQEYLKDPSLKQERVYKETEVMYLRKANQIHRYFIENFANGDKEASEVKVELADLLKLKTICLRILKETETEKGLVNNGWGSTTYKSTERIILAKQVGNKFEQGATKEASELEAGDLIWRTPDSADKVKSTELGSTLRVEYDCLFCEKRMKNPLLAQTLLPTQDGFFFGSTDYDEWYLEDLKSYVEQVKIIEKEHKDLVESGIPEYDIQYVYWASW